MRKKITTIGNSAAVMVPREFPAQMMGVQVGDEVELTMENRTLLIRSVEQVARDEKVQAAADDVFRIRRSALKRLAE